MSTLEMLLRDRLNHAFSVKTDLGEGLVVSVSRSKAQLLREPYTPGVTDTIVSHLAGCACKPMPRVRTSRP